MNELITQHLDLWTSAITSKVTAGRGNKSPSPAGEGRGEGNPTSTRNAKYTAYGIKKLRELILELAVRGKLVSQDPNDEPANILLNKIAEKKAFLMANGELKNQPKLAKIRQENLPFILPKNWQWARLGDITNYGITDKVEPNGVHDSIWVLELEDIEKETSRLLRKVRYAERDFQSSKNRFVENDVLYGKLRPYLDKVIVADEDGVCTTEIIPLRAFDCITPQYLKLVLKSPYFINYANNSTHGMNLPRLGTDRARLALFPLAPELEQHRIVAKVDELMALCDQLEQQQTDNIAAHQTLVQTLLETLTQAADATEFEQAWNRIADHFDTLFTTESSIDQLKQTLLQLAVMGKLVPQDLNDVPAKVLLAEIATEIKKLVNDGTIKKPSTLSEIKSDEKPYDLPDLWEWTRLGSCGITNTGKTPSTGNPAYFGGDIQFVGPGQITPDGQILESDKTLTKDGCEYSTLANPGDILMVCIGGSIGKCAVANSTISFNQQINSISPITVNSRFLSFAMNAPHFQKAIISAATGSATPIINKSKWENLLITLPPLAEQQRIVTKVDELMALCDALKARIATAQTTQLQLADAIVEQAFA